MAKILIVEDDVIVANNIKDWLELERFAVEIAPNAGDAVRYLELYRYDVIIMDWELPDGTGYEVCRTFRARGGVTPILFLTGKDSIENKVQGLDIGADDYVTKPFQLKELAARIRVLLRRTPGTEPEIISCGQLTLEIGTFRVKNSGQEVTLLPKEFALLEYLVRHPNQAFIAKALMSAVWKTDGEASEDTIRTHIKNLRKK